MTLPTGKRNSRPRPAGPGPRRRREPADRFTPAAFTLIEILLVVVILAVLAAVSLPNFSRNFRRLRLKQAADDLSFALRYARSRAVTAERDTALVFSGGFHSYRLEENAPDGFRGLDGRWGKVFVIPPEITVEASQEAVSFRPDGTMDKARVELCRKEECYLVSTGLVRGQVEVFSYQTDE